MTSERVKISRRLLLAQGRGAADTNTGDKNTWFVSVYLAGIDLVTLNAYIILLEEEWEKMHFGFKGLVHPKRW